MGRTKTKFVDDSSAPETNKVVKAKGKPKDELVERLRAELEAEEGPKKQVKTEEGSVASKSEDVKEEKESVKDAEPVQKEKKTQKPGKSKPRSKKYQEISKDLDRAKSYPISEAVELTKKLSYTKFVGTMEAHINTVQTGMRGLVSLPFVSGKKLKILAFGKDAKDCGADVEGTEESIEEINKGKVGYDLIITTPEWMPKLAKVARILGPRGMMPNPKNGTITSDLKKAVEGFQSGKTEYKTEGKAAVIHLGLGKLDQPTEELSANIKVLLATLGKSKIKKVALSPTMGPSVKIDLSSL